MEIETLTSENLVLRKIQTKDAQDILGLFSDDENIKYIDNKKHESIEDSLNMIQSFDKKLHDETAIFWGITLKSSEKLIGISGLYQLDWKHRFASSKSIIHHSYWRQGVAMEAKQQIYDYAFTQLHLHRIEAQVFVKHTASIQHLEKMGMKREGRLRQNFLINQTYQDSYLYALLKSD